MSRDTILASELKAVCTEAGLPTSAKVLVRHHRNNAAAAAGADLMSAGWMSPRQIRELQVAIRELAERFVEDRREPDKLLCHVSSLRRVAIDIEPAPDEEPDDGLRFWVTLLRVSSANRRDAQVALQNNCTYVAGPYWIMEGDTDCLADEGVRFTKVKEGSVPSLGDRSIDELTKICQESFGVDVSS